MNQNSRIRRCKRCGEDKEWKARGLCVRCYGFMEYHGMLDEFPLMRAGETPLVCVCADPTVEVAGRIPAEQCASCKRLVVS